MVMESNVLNQTCDTKTQSRKKQLFTDVNGPQLINHHIFAVADETVLIKSPLQQSCRTCRSSFVM